MTSGKLNTSGLKMRNWALLMVFTFLISTGVLAYDTSQVQAAVQATYYVSPSGSDTNPGTLAAPFKTITKARDVVDTINNSMTGDIIVNLRAGDYYVDSTIVFDENDSGTNGHFVIYQNYDGLGSARIIGGKKLTGWALAPGSSNIYKTNVGIGWNFDTLFENGERSNLARFPNTGYSKIQKEDNTQPKKAFYYQTGVNMPPIANISSSGLQVFVWPGAHNWANEILPVTAINTANKKITLSQNQRWPYLGNLTANSRYFIQGAYELLDRAGEFYLNRVTGYLFYYPVSTADINSQEIIAPTVDKVILLNGSTNTNLIRNIQFIGLTVKVSNSTYLDLNSGKTGNIVMVNAENITIKNSRILNSSSNGITMPVMDLQTTPVISIVRNNTITGNYIHDVGDSGVRITGIGNTKNYTHTNHTVSNNEITDIARIATNGAGVYFSNAADSNVTNNKISDASHYGIEIKGSKWTEMPAVIEGIAVTAANRYDFNPGRNNVVEFNDVFKVNLDSQDTGIFKSGGVYNMTVNNNVLHDSGNFGLQKGLYLDDVSDHGTVTNNIVYGLKGGTKITYNIKGTENLVQNNIADATGGAKGMQFNIIGNQPTKDHVLLNNIIFNARVFYTLENYRSNYVKTSNYNVFYNAGAADTFSGIPGQDSFTGWKSLPQKYDVNSTTANPLFVNASTHNYNLQTGSPALARGFNQIDISTVGLKADYPYSDVLAAMIVDTSIVEPDPIPSFSEGFENGFGVWTPTFGTPTATTTRANSGVSSYFPNEDQDEIMHVMDDQTYGILTVMFYDNVSFNDMRVRARLYNSTTEENAMIGVVTNTSTPKYSYLVDGTTWVASSKNRTTGWHEFKFDMSSGKDTKLYIDGTLIATTDIITGFNELYLGDIGATSTQGNVYFDDVNLYDNFEQYEY